jgi:hypothetical protein
MGSIDIIVSPGRPTSEETSAQVKRILESSPFQNSDASRQLLAFLAQWSLDHPGQHVKETEVALSVFHRRPESFDSQTDSVVRVQMARLRAKLLDYYANYGIGDEVFIDIPKGSYVIASSYRQSAPSLPIAEIAPDVIEHPEEPQPAIPQVWNRYPGYSLAAVLALGALLGGGLTFLSMRTGQQTVPPRLQQFWSQAMPKGAPNLAVFSNPRLAGTLADEGLHYFREGVDSQSPQAENLSYAGAADAKSVGTLMHLFDSFNQELVVQSGARLSWDEAKESNLIFIDRPEQNPALHKLPRLREFYFKFHAGIVNAHPQPGELPAYGCSTRPYTYDHAVIALIPGLNRSRNTLILAGATTYGSQAAAEFVSREGSVGELLDRLGVKPDGKIPYFEALLEVRINNETPVWSKLIAHRLHPADKSSWEPPALDEK